MEEIKWYQSGRRLYYLSSGTVIFDTGEGEGTDELVRDFDNDYKLQPSLKEYPKEEIAYLDFKYGQYRDEFEKCVFYKINPLTEDIQFAFKSEGTPVLSLPLEKRVEMLEDALLLQIDNEFGGIL